MKATSQWSHPRTASGFSLSLRRRSGERGGLRENGPPLPHPLLPQREERESAKLGSGAVPGCAQQNALLPAELTRLRFNPKPLRFHTHRTPLQTWVNPAQTSRDSPQTLPDAIQTQRERFQTTWEHPQMIRENVQTIPDGVQMMQESAQMIPACSQTMRETPQMRWETLQTIRAGLQTMRESSQMKWESLQMMRENSQPFTFSSPRAPDALKQGRPVPIRNRAVCHRNPVGGANVLVSRELPDSPLRIRWGEGSRRPDKVRARRNGHPHGGRSPQQHRLRGLAHLVSPHRFLASRLILKG